MALLKTRLTELLYVPSTVGAIYTNPAASKSFVRGLMLHNTNTSSETVGVHWVPDAAGAVGTATLANRFLNVVLVTGATLIVEVPFALVMTDTNETLQAVTTTASKVTVAVIGDKDA